MTCLSHLAVTCFPEKKTTYGSYWTHVVSLLNLPWLLLCSMKLVVITPDVNVGKQLLEGV